MDETTQKTITRRLASAAGHLKGIERMVAEDVYCIDIIKQIQAVQAALNKVSTLMLENHFLPAQLFFSLVSFLVLQMFYK